MQQNSFNITGVRIVVIGVGGAGNNAVNRMIDNESEDSPLQFYVMNTDRQSLLGSKVPEANRIILGEKITEGMGAGGDPRLGEKAALESESTIRNIVKGANMVFIAAGMGGGTGTGAGPVIANICRSENALTIAIVTRPFSFEGKLRIDNSIEGYNKMKEAVDSIIIVSNDKLLMENGTSKISDAFEQSDLVLSRSIKTITDLITIPGIINLDFADVRNTLRNSGVALIGYGTGSGPTKANDAAMAAISSPLLETPIGGARRAICSVTCGPDVSLYEAQDCVNKIVEEAGSGVDVKLGVSINDQLVDQIIVSVIATCFPNEANLSPNTDLLKQNTEKKDTSSNTLLNDEKEDETNEEEEEDILPDFLKDKNIG